MSAQPGGSVLLSYGPQGLQQAGGAVLLAYGGQQAQPTAPRARFLWNASQNLRPLTRGLYASATTLDDRTAGNWTPGADLDDATPSYWLTSTPQDDDTASAWTGPMAQAQPQQASRWTTSAPTDRKDDVPWGGPMAALEQRDQARWTTSTATDDAARVPWGGPMLTRLLTALARFPASATMDPRRYIPWTRFSRTLNPGWGAVNPDTPGPAPGEPITILPSRVYIVSNTATLVRSSDNALIPAFGLAVNFDADSWVPGFTAEVSAGALATLTPNPDPVEVTATINGFQFRFLVERIARSRQFGRSRLTISGRNPAAVLGDPYADASAYSNTNAATAQQLVGSALTNTGYTIEWGITDWLVPAGAFKSYGTPIHVAQRVADAAGAVLIADHELNVLRFLPRYPTAPWEWAGVTTPDYTLPTSLAVTEAIEWDERPAYNRVFVSGTEYGVIGNVKRDGTAGDVVAPMITDSLITAEQAARQRGLAVLADTGRKARLTLSLPMPEELGPLDLSKLVAFGTTGAYRRGLVRAVSISVDQGASSIRQTVTIEAAP